MHGEAYKLIYDENSHKSSKQSGGPGGKRVVVIMTQECRETKSDEDLEVQVLQELLPLDMKILDYKEHDSTRNYFTNLIQGEHLIFLTTA